MKPDEIKKPKEIAVVTIRILRDGVDAHSGGKNTEVESPGNHCSRDDAVIQSLAKCLLARYGKIKAAGIAGMLASEIHFSK